MRATQARTMKNGVIIFANSYHNNIHCDYDDDDDDYYDNDDDGIIIT